MPLKQELREVTTIVEYILTASPNARKALIAPLDPLRNNILMPWKLENS